MGRILVLLLLVGVSWGGDLRLVQWTDGQLDSLVLESKKSAYFRLPAGKTAKFEGVLKLYVRSAQLGALHQIGRLDLAINGKPVNKDLPLVGESKSPEGRVSISKVWIWERGIHLEVKNKGNHTIWIRPLVLKKGSSEVRMEGLKPVKLISPKGPSMYYRLPSGQGTKVVLKQGDYELISRLEFDQSMIGLYRYTLEMNLQNHTDRKIHRVLPSRDFTHPDYKNILIGQARSRVFQMEHDGELQLKSSKPVYLKIRSSGDVR